MIVDDAQAEHLAGKASAAAQLTSATSSDIQSLYTQALSRRAELDRASDQKYVALAPTLVSLSQQASTSKQLLSSLETFLSTFQTDLSTLSTHISALQSTSHQIDSQLDATRDVEIHLAAFLSDIALSPRIVDLFFDTDPESRPELWLKAVNQLERVLDATLPSATLDLPGGEKLALADVQAVKEVRSVAESCKNVVAGKLRTYLTAPHAAIKASVTTNLQVLQTSVLLRHHRPFYAFLARQMPRVAIDVQRSYVGAARLYFETAFRRYTRSLGVIRKRWTEAAAASNITDPAPAGNDADYAQNAANALQTSMATLTRASAAAGAGGVGEMGGRAGGSTPVMRGASQDAAAGDGEAMAVADAWMFPASRMVYSRLESSAATVLGYLADETSFKACPENLFRSLSLVLVDNVCSEYTFIVRFFESISDDLEAKEGLATEASSTTGDEEVEPSVVQLSRSEQDKLRGRGASEEVFRQIMEPAVTTWTTFVKTLLPNAGVSAYFAALAMVQLNDGLIQLIVSRGCENALVSTAMMGFKLDVYPLLKRFLDDQITALSSPTPSTSLWKSISMSSPTQLDSKIIAVRYVALFAKSLWLLQIPDPAILSALTRLRSQLATSLPTPQRPQTLNLLIHTLELALPPPLASHPAAQNEFAFWNSLLHP